MFNLWIDDMRTPPDETWHWSKSVSSAKTHFIQLGGGQRKPGIISLDHDAGVWGPPDYIRFLVWLEEKSIADNWDLSNIQFHLHTMNPAGRQNMRAIIEHNGWKEIYNV